MILRSYKIALGVNSHLDAAGRVIGDPGRLGGK
jgi:hypothetical protein